MTPQQRERKYWKDQNAVIDTVESYNAVTKRRKDLFGCFDLIVMHGSLSRPALIQITNGANHAARVKKVRETAPKVCWLYFHIMVASWRKNAKGRWTRREEVLTLS